MTAIQDPRIQPDIPNMHIPEFWIRDAGVIDADIARLHAESPLVFQPEETVPPELQEIFRPGVGAWMVTKHRDIAEISKNPEIFSSAAGITVRDTDPEAAEFFSSMIVMDDPRHARMRKLVSAGFTPRMLHRLEDSVQEIAAEIVDDVCERGTVDFVVDVAAALPLRIVCDLMGIPPERYLEVFDFTNMILGATDPEYLKDPAEMVTTLVNAGMGLAQIMNEVAASKRGGDSDDLTTILVNSEIDGEKLTDSELASFFILLTVAGNETTRNAIAWGLKYLTDNPNQRAIWQADFDGVGNTAIEEIVRLASPVTHMRRTATQDVELGGQQILEGDKLVMYYYAANRDPEVFANPSAFDVLRQPTPTQIGFGGAGPHFCLGAHLARREITVMFRELFERLPDIHASGEPDLLRSNFIHGVKHLEATFTPTAPRG